MPKHKPFIQSTYLSCVLDASRLRRTIKRALATIRPHARYFDTIAFRGLSGALVAPVLARGLGKHLLVVRKIDGSHSVYGVEGNIATRSYLFVDDFIASGETLRGTVTAIREEQERVGYPAGACYGALLYAESSCATSSGYKLLHASLCPHFFICGRE